MPVADRQSMKCALSIGLVALTILAGCGSEDSDGGKATGSGGHNQGGSGGVAAGGSGGVLGAESECVNGLDDDGDGAIDCADSDCAIVGACAPAPDAHVATIEVE